MYLNQLIKKLEFTPQKLFLIDGLGAILSAFLLGVVLVKLERIFGIPPTTLYFLAVLPVFFAVYDYFCYQKEHPKIGQYLKGIAIVNLLYCCLSIGFAFYHLETITSWGWAYILLEILVVLVLALLELVVAKRWTS